MNFTSSLSKELSARLCRRDLKIFFALPMRTFLPLRQALWASAFAKSLAYAHGPAKNDVLMSFDELQAEELLEDVSIHSDSGVPVKPLQGLVGGYRSGFHPPGEAVALPPRELILEDELEELRIGELVRLGISNSVLKAEEDARQTQLLEYVLQFIHRFPPRMGC